MESARRTIFRNLRQGGGHQRVIDPGATGTNPATQSVRIRGRAEEFHVDPSIGQVRRSESFPSSPAARDLDASSIPWS